VLVELLAITPDAERLIERAGRTCYMSQGRITEESSGKFIRMLVSKGHLSVLEHACATFRISGISRAATHQLVRHRLCSFSQRSQRYVKEAENGFVVPPSVSRSDEALAVFKDSVAASTQAYMRLLSIGIPREDARFVMPNATRSELVVSANFRELRHVIMTRGSKEAQWEVRRVVTEMLGFLKQHAPNVFGDLATSDSDLVERHATGHS
jgi:thymidylate synthase (FAD)